MSHDQWSRDGETRSLLPRPSLDDGGDLVAPLRKPSSGSIYGLTALAAVSGFMFGYDTGIVSGAMLLIVKDLGLQGNTFKQELIVSVTLVGCIVSSILSKPLIEICGRRMGILVAAFIFTVGAAVMWASRATSTPFETLVAGRFLVGLGVGLASMVTPVYIGEVAPSRIRGKLITLNNVFITGGQFIACVVAGALSKYDYPHGWEVMLGLSGVPAAIQFVGMLFAIESPRWLAKYRGRAAALHALERVRPSTALIDAEADDIMASIKEENRLHANEFGFFDLLRSRSMRSILLLGASLQAVQQLSGINTVMYYAGTIVTMAGWTDVSDAIWITAGFSFIGFLSNVAGMLQVERQGRRFIVLGSLAGVTVSLAALGLAFYQLRATSPHAHAAVPFVCDYSSCYECVVDHACGFCGGFCIAGNTSAPLNATVCPTDDKYYGESCPTQGFNWGYIALAATTFYLAFFQAGMGPAPWVINSEIFPLRAKSVGVATTTFVNWSCNLLISFTFLDLCNAITRFGAFWLYGGVGALGFAWFYFALPETRGKRLEEIEALFDSDLKGGALANRSLQRGAHVTINDEPG